MRLSQNAPGFASGSKEHILDDLKKQIDQPAVQYWPELRWWLAEGFHTDETLKKDIALIHEAGFGAVEFLAMDEDGADSSRYGWGSEEWVHDSRLVMREASKRGMGVSVTSGTNWATANLTTILPDDKSASKELNFSSETLAPGQTREGPIFPAQISQPNVHEQILVAVVAGKRLSRTYLGAVLDKDSLVVLTDRVDDKKNLSWNAPDDGLYELLFFWMHGTGQTASPAQGTAYSINYVDPYGIESLISYWEKTILTPDFAGLIRKNKRFQMYMDSLELKTFGRGGQFWGYTFIEEFKKRRGYDIVPYLPFIIRPYDRGLIGMPVYYYDSGDSEFDKKLRNDFYHVLTELYIDNVLKPFQVWLHTAGMTLRAEISYGMPYEISLPGKYVDGIEGESLDFASQPEAFRGFAGMAFLFNKPYSSETGAFKQNYMMPLNFFNQIIFTQFACGVSRIVLHGYASIAGSDASTRWPGHEGMWPVFSERFGIRQPAWKHYPGWTAMLSRFQFLLRQGSPRRDILILRLDYHFNGRLHRNNGIRDSIIYERLYFRRNEGIYWRDMSLQNSGYTYDYIAPQLLEEEEVSFGKGVINPDGASYKALIIYQEEMPFSSAKKILEWARRGLPVILVNGVTEMVRNETYVTHNKAACRTPYYDQLDDDLGDLIKKIKSCPNVQVLDNQKDTLAALRRLDVSPYAAFEEPNKKIITFTRHNNNLRYLYLYNYMYTEKEPFSFIINMEGRGKPYLINCWQNSIREIKNYSCSESYTRFGLTLAPGEAVVAVMELGKDADAPMDPAGQEPEVLEITGWELEVESWDQGEKREILEDRGLGYVTREVYYETRKTLIPVGKTPLIPWKDMPPVGEAVSGMGYYRAKFNLPAAWLDNRPVLLKMENTQGNSAAVYVNGIKAPALDYCRLETDIGVLLREGENDLLIEVSSTLNNRLAARGYFDKINDFSGVFINGKPRTLAWKAADYGLTGKVRLFHSR
jgi:hypothetical protein